MVERGDRGPRLRLDELDAFVGRALADARVPGVAVAIVERGEVVLARGWGVRRVGAPEPVTASTRFAIGSVTKSLTSLLAARLVDAGAVRWDTPVTELLPGFALADADVTRALTLRHTLSLCLGMPRRDAELVFGGEVSAEERVAALRTHRPTTRPGEAYCYSNVLVAVGGYAAGQAHAPGEALGDAYRRAMRERVLEPLGMAATTFDLVAVAGAEHAAPHPRDLDGAPVAYPPAAWTSSIAPAGAAWSTAADLACVLQLELGGGELGGRRVISAEALLARRAPQVAISADASYGLGLVIERAHGAACFGHVGGTAGFSTVFCFLPERELGVAVLANAGNAHGFTAAVRRRILELWLGGEERDEPALAELAAALEAERRDRSAIAARITEADPAWAAPLVGRWAAPGLPAFDLRRDHRGRLVLDRGLWQVVLAGTRTASGAPALLSAAAPLIGLELAPRGEGASVELVASVADQEPIVFRRAAG